MKTQCNSCFRHCTLDDGQTGFCGARQNCGGTILATNYGYTTALALDPIEKKPLAMFHPGAKILSIGSFGCNLACPFCQNSSISREFLAARRTAERISSEALLEKAIELQPAGNIGIAFTYNEPLVGWEFVRDTAKLFSENGLKTAIVTNGCFAPEVLDAVLPFTDAMNIDLKTFSDDGYKNLGGDLAMVQAAIKRCATNRAKPNGTHVELTTLIVPGINDAPDEMRREAAWIASVDEQIPLHVTRYFPRYKMTGGAPTPVAVVHKLADVAREFLPHVFVGNC